MQKFTFEKCLSSHGVFLTARLWNGDLLAAYYPLYEEFKLYNTDYPELEKYMRAYHFDHQFDEIPRFRAMCDFKSNRRFN